jgi:hypothetical protein
VNHFNQTTCPSCGCQAVAPGSVRIRIKGSPSLSHDFIPYLRDIIDRQPGGP